MTRPSHRREMAGKAVAVRGVSIALACRTFDVSETCYRYKAKLFGLSIAPERLAEIRHERRPGSRYASIENCQYEVREAEALMRQLAPGWKLAPDASRIERAFSFKDFFRTMSFVNAAAHVANVEDHHPDLEVGYGYCRVRWNTHAVNGLSENDFICAAKASALLGEA